MTWTVHGSRPVYRSDWVNLDLLDVEMPDGQRIEQNVVRMVRPVAAGAVVVGDRVLLMWRYRHVTGSRGWEIPMGRVEADESPVEAAAREIEEETGWRPGPLTLIAASEPSNGTVDSVHYLFRADSAQHIGPPVDITEAERIEWVPLANILGLVAEGRIVSGPTLIALLHVLAERAGQREVPVL
ncbi:NUDIX domain-containing protein [Sinosporangium siamense]|uniref:NUDIX hydrolase n=1 Tax=Sinosporangium siamense TaxID=1367973 RepID=A0A919VBU3_9ACTN|nr:NUDIX hydrolase [Sinosporangium siamense]GII92479.1 NUDIX hydrolase [Sinosporangium siamense]